MDQNSPIQEKLIRFQKQTGLSWEHVAHVCGVSTRSIYQWLRGQSPQMAKWLTADGGMRVYRQSRREEKQRAKSAKASAKNAKAKS